MVEQESDALFPDKKLRKISSVSSGQNTISAVHYSARLVSSVVPNKRRLCDIFELPYLFVPATLFLSVFLSYFLF